MGYMERILHLFFRKCGYFSDDFEKNRLVGKSFQTIFLAENYHNKITLGKKNFFKIF